MEYWTFVKQYDDANTPSYWSYLNGSFFASIEGKKNFKKFLKMLSSSKEEKNIKSDILVVTKTGKISENFELIENFKLKSGLAIISEVKNER